MIIETKQNFISTDRQTVRNSNGEFFTIGEEVGHEDKDAGTATILNFEMDEEYNEIKVHTTSGYAHLDFLVKL